VNAGVEGGPLRVYNSPAIQIPARPGMLSANTSWWLFRLDQAMRHSIMKFLDAAPQDLLTLVQTLAGAWE
jgi:hypothetical protein